MTESEWLVSDDPARMLGHLASAAATLKARLRLFACACCRRLWELLNEECRAVLLRLEQLATGARVAGGLRGAQAVASAAARGMSEVACRIDQSEEWDSPVRLNATARNFAASAVWQAGKRAPAAAARCHNEAAFALGCARVAREVGPGPPLRCNALVERAQKDEFVAQAALLRDVIGNPFRGVRFDTSWLRAGAPSLARGAYDERDPAAGTLDPMRLGILADALEESGCADELIFTHLRSPGPHVFGCWAVDLVLEKQ